MPQVSPNLLEADMAVETPAWSVANCNRRGYSYRKGYP